MKLTVTFENSRYEFPYFLTAASFLKEHTDSGVRFAAVKINGVPAPLSAVLNRSCRLETVASDSP